MRQQDAKLVKLACINVRIGLSLIETSSAYSGNLRHYKANVLTSLGAVIEALSGVFCELAKHQSVNASRHCEQSVFTEKIKSRNILISAKRYLEKCLILLTEDKSNASPPFTDMYARAQTLAYAIGNSINQ